MALAASLALAATTAAPATAVDESKPPPACYGLNFADKKNDQASQAPASQDAPRENLDLLGGFYKFDSAKAAEAATINLQIANLSTEIPPGVTAISWYVSYGQESGDQWLRAITDYTGIVSYEYGHFEIVGPQTQSVRDGAMQGAFFEGPDGVIQLVMPATGPGKPGTALKAPAVFAYEAAQVLPGASPTPAKGGLLFQVDTAAGKPYTVGSPCPATPPAAPAPAAGPTVTPPALNSGGAFPGKLVTKSVRAKKVKRSLALKLRSTEALTNVGAQLRRGRKTLGKGTLAKLDGAGTVKVKLKGRLKKGSYTVDLVGIDKSGAKRFGVAKLKAR